MHTDTAPIAVSAPLKYFVRTYTYMKEVQPLTKASRDNEGTVLVRAVIGGEIFRIKDEDLIRYHP